jgi:hypothetical protein
MTRNIRRDHWGEFLQNIGVQHEGWVVAVERIGTASDPALDRPSTRPLELHESTLDAVDCEIDEDEATVIFNFIDNRPLHIEDLARVSWDEVEEQDGKIIDLETRKRQIIRLWLRMPQAGRSDDLEEADLAEQDADEPPPAEAVLQIRERP